MKIDKEKDFICGFGAAICTLVYGWRKMHLAKMIIEENGLNLSDFKCCDKFDLKIIKKAIKEG